MQRAPRRWNSVSDRTFLDATLSPICQRRQHRSAQGGTVADVTMVEMNLGQKLAKTEPSSRCHCGGCTAHFERTSCPEAASPGKLKIEETHRYFVDATPSTFLAELKRSFCLSIDNRGFSVCGAHVRFSKYFLRLSTAPRQFHQCHHAFTGRSQPVAG